MQVMGCRYAELTAGLAALDKGAVPLVGYSGNYHSIGTADDIGSYIFIPQIARFFNLPLEVACDVFYFGTLAASLVVGTLGLVLHLRSWTGRAVALALLAVLTVGVVEHGDVYLAAPCCLIACVPWAFWLAERADRTWVLLGGAALLGLTVGTANLIRGHAGSGVLLTSLILVGFAARHTIFRRVAFAAALLAGVAVPMWYQSHLIRQADKFLKENSSSYAGRLGTAHPMWHSIYIGLGYLNNQHGITYSDSVAAQAAREIDPQAPYMSHAYERILRGRVWDLYQRDPEFIHQTLFAKAGYAAFCLVRYAHFGLLAALLGVLSRRQFLALLCGAGFSSLPGILVMPYSSYLLGFRAFASLIAVLALGKYFEHDWSLARVQAWLSARKQAALVKFERQGVPALRFAVLVAACSAATHYSWKVFGTVKSTVAVSYHDAKVLALKKLASSGSLAVARKLDLGTLQWETTAKGADLKQEDKQLLLKTGGDRYEFQIESKIPITEEVVYTTYELEVLTGGVALGIMTDKGMWAETIYCNTPGKYQGTLAAYVKDTKDIRLIVYNFNASAPAGDVSSTCRIKDFTVTLGDERSATSAVAGKDSGAELKR